MNPIIVLVPSAELIVKSEKSGPDYHRAYRCEKWCDMTRVVGRAQKTTRMERVKVKKAVGQRRIGRKPVWYIYQHDGACQV